MRVATGRQPREDSDSDMHIRARCVSSRPLFLGILHNDVDFTGDIQSEAFGGGSAAAVGR